MIDRIERQRRRARIVQDGRGVFAPVIGDNEEFAEYGEDDEYEAVGGRPPKGGGKPFSLANEYGDPEDWDPDDAGMILEASAHEYFDDDDNMTSNGGRVELASVRVK